MGTYDVDPRNYLSKFIPPEPANGPRHTDFRCPLPPLPARPSHVPTSGCDVTINLAAAFRSGMEIEFFSRENSMLECGSHLFHFPVEEKGMLEDYHVGWGIILEQR